MSMQKLIHVVAVAAPILMPVMATQAQNVNVFTLQIGAVAAPPTTVVHHTNTWSYRRGTNEPVANWQTIGEASLDATWITGPGGFGYGDAGIAGESTTLSGMEGVHSTLYLRKTFTIGSIADTNLHLRLTVDYDDGFVAFLDGVEVARRNLTNGVGTFVAYNNTTVTSHEASCCNSPNPAENIDLGAVSNRLASGEHVLALIGVNGTLGSSDFHLAVDLTLDGGAAPAANGTYLSLVTTNTITLSGSNTVPGSAGVTINGDAAVFNAVAGTWVKTQTLSPGMNRLFIAALDASGAILASTNWDIVCQLSSVAVGGVLAGNTAWTSAMGIIQVTNNLTVGAGNTLSIGPGVVVLLSANASILAQTNGSVAVAGTENAPVFFLPADGATLWGELCADGTNASLAVRHAETVAGRVRALAGGTVLVEDSTVRDFPSATREIVAGVNGAQLTLRRTHIARYSEIDSRDTPFLAEDCLIEQPSVDGMDIKSTNASVPLIVRRTTLRFGSGNNTDALDLGPGPNVTIERCLLHDWPDKGVSVGAGSAGVVVRGCLFYNVGKGVEVADSATAVLYNNTVSVSSNGFKLFEKTTGQGAGHATATNNILWGNSNAVVLANGATLEITHSDIEGGSWPGTGNLAVDPLFRDPALKDFRLSAGSPALGAGLGGADMGAIFPVGGIPAKPANLAALTVGAAPIQLAWLDQCENEEAFVVQRSSDGLAWQTLGTAPAHATNYTDTSAQDNQLYYYRVRATNATSVSPFSNLASARRQAANVVSGTLTSNTIWSAALSPILVAGDVTVPTNVTLTIEAGTVVRLTNNAMLIASTGGVIRILGTWDKRVVLECWNGTNNWGEVRATGTNASLDIHFADISGGQTTVYYDATALLEDTLFRDFRRQGTTTLYNQPLILTHYAGPCFVRRCHLDNYHETLWRHGVNVIEDTVFEHTSGDALDFDTGRPGSVIRRCTFRHGNLGNVDAIDIGNDGANGTEGAVIEDCHMFDFPFDKGVSIGENSFNITVRNSLIHNVVRGIQVKDICTANIYNCTVTEAQIGIHGYEKSAGTGAGRVTNSYNNILWGLSSNAIVYDLIKSEMVVNYSNLQGTNWPTGTGNISSDPLFVNPAAGDWRLQAGSPCLGAGKDGANMGVTFPVGVFITAPSGLAAAAGSNSVTLAWRDNSPSEAVFLIERATDGGPFAELAFVPLNTTNYADPTVLAGHVYRYRVRGANINTNSAYSAEAQFGDNGTIAFDTTWYATNGIYVVTNNLLVASNATLTIEPGVTVQVRQGCGFTINGRLLADGTASQPIKFTRFPGDATWERIMFVAAEDSRLRNCIIEYCNSVGDHQDYYPTNCGPPALYAPRAYHEAVVVLAGHVDFESCSFTNLPDASATAEGDALAIISDDAQHPGPASANIRGCHFIRIGQGVHTRYARVLVENCDFKDKHGDNDDVDLFGESTPASVIRYNQFLYPSYEDRINPTRCSALIYGNKIYGSTDHGIVLRDVSRPVLFNNIIYNCTSGGITVQNGCDALLVNNTLVNCNRAIKLFDHTGRLGPPYCLAAASGRATVVNCIIWNSSPAFDLSGASGGPIQEFYLNVSHSNIQGGTNNATLASRATIAWGDGIISVDPRFADAAGTNFHLLADSPCIDAGTNQTYLGTNLSDFIAHDLDGFPRPFDGNADGVARFDLGAYEYLPPSAQPQLRLVASAGYLPGIPVLVRIEILDTNGAVDRTVWDATAVLTTDRPEVVLSTNLASLKNGLGSALVTFTGGTNFVLTATVGNLATTRSLTSLAAAPVTLAAGLLPVGTNVWSGIIRVTSDVTVPAGARLQIQPGTLVLMDGVASGTTAPDLLISGAIESLGTPDQPITITCSDGALRWGQIRHNTAQPSLYRYTSITRAGRAPGEGHTGTAPVIRPSNSTITFENCNFTDHADMVRGSATFGTPGKVMYGVGSDLTLRDCLLSRARMGPEIQSTAVLMTNCWMIDMRGPDDADGFYIHAQQAGQSCAFKRCVAAGGDDDGFDTLDSIVQIEDTILRDWSNLLEDAKAVSVFNGETHLHRCLIVDSTVGVAAKWSSGAPTLVTVNQSTLTGNYTNVMAAWKANAPGPFIDFRITNCVLWGNNSAHSDFGDTNLTIVYSDLFEPWTGVGNLQADPLFVDAANHDYRLGAGSPCINTGDPVSPPDPDGSRADMGYLSAGTSANPALQAAITSPSPGAMLYCPTNLTISASASSSTGSVTRVEFFAGTNSLGIATGSPYSVVWSNVPPGAYALTAVAMENGGNLATSAPVNITAILNVAPVVNLASPTNGASFTSPGPVTITADASDADGNLARVEFFAGANKLGEVATGPFNLVWYNIPAGAYSLTAVASDSAGLRATSAPVSLTIEVGTSPWGALQFNGSNQYVTFGRAPLGASNFTLEAWIHWTGQGLAANSGSGGISAIPVITKGRGEGDNSNLDCNYFLGIRTNGLLAADFEEYPTFNAGGTNQPIIGVTPVTTNTWHHVAATYDGTNWCLYLDGQLESQRTVGKPPRWDSLQHAALGSSLTSTGAPQGYFAGLLDEARIWNYARSAAEISNSMTMNIAAAPGLLGRWSLDETLGNLSYDSSGNNIHGTNMNSPGHNWGYPFVTVPLVAITSPHDGDQFYTPDSLEIFATASVISGVGSVTQVEFFVDATSLGVATNSPYRVVWSNSAPGVAVLTAVVTESGGRQATSAPVTVSLYTNFPPSVSIMNPASNAIFVVPTNLLIEAVASDREDAIVRVEFYQGAVKLGADDAAPYGFTWLNVPPGELSLTAVATDSVGMSATSAPVAITVSRGGPTTNTVVALGSAWKYLDNGSDQGTSWTQPDFNDSGWPSGPAQLGYGDGDEATVVGYGPDANNKYITTYFRRPFVVPDASRVTNLLLRLLRDDGAVVYLNGQEVYRVNMPTGTIGYQTPASAAGTYVFLNTNLPVGALVTGTNLLAVEIHQANATSSDISFELSLQAVLTAPTNLLPNITLISPANDVTLAAPADLVLAAEAFDYDGSVTSFEFRTNDAVFATLTASPYSVGWSNIPAGVYALTAIALDNLGQSATSAVVTVTVSTNIARPVVLSQAPAPGTIGNLTQITVIFSKPVLGVDAGDLLINGTPAGSLSGSGASYAFLFAQPPYGPVTVSWAANHGITDVFAVPHAFDGQGEGAAWQYLLTDQTPPLATSWSPTPGAILPALTSASVSFNENVTGLNASDLLINGFPATQVAGTGAGPYLFDFAQPANGTVQLSWAAGHGIQDDAGNAFVGVPWSCTLDTNVAGILISEIMYHPQSENNNEEFIELFNSGPTNVQLAGWRLSQGVRFAFPGVDLPSGGYLVVAANVATFTNLYPGVTNVVGGWEGILSNNRNTIRLEDAQGRRADTVSYATEGDWAIRQRSAPDRGYQGWHWLKEHDGHGKSLELINPSLPNEHGQNWAASLAMNGTPGRANSVALASTPPLILDVQHLPAIPSTTDPVIVSARILDERASNVTVTLYWRVDAATPPPFISTNLFDDGTHGDAVAGDGLFAATLPPQAQSAIVEFYVQAEDQDGLARTWPAAVLDTTGASLGQVCNALFQVDTNRYTGNQPIYRLVMTERERVLLDAIQHDSPAGAAQSDATMNGGFVSVDGTGSDCRYRIGIRNRGHGTRTAHPNNFRVNFSLDQRWKNVEALNLNGQYTYSQVFGAAVAQRAGVAGADSRAVQVRVNGTNLALLDNYPDRTYGSYAANEVLNSDWAEHHFPADGSGNIYQAIRDDYTPSANFEYRGANKAAYTNCFFKKTNASQDDWSDLAAMLRIMGTNDLFSTDNARQAINVDQWLLHLAVMTLLGNNETGLNSGYNDDYFMYRGVNDPRFILVYYDLDSVVNRGQATNSSIWGCTTRRLSPPQDTGTAMAQLLYWPEFEPVYYRTLQRLIDTTFSAPQFNALLNQVLGSYVPGTTLQAMTNWMNGRRDYVQSVIAPYVTPTTSAPVALISGEPRAVTPLTSATLSVGGADIAAYRFSLNGGDYGDETPASTPITFLGLPHDRTNTVRVVGRNAAGAWQSTNSPTISRSWIVRTNWPSVRLNEILARNDSAVNWYGKHPDLIELFNEGAGAADLSGLRLTDDPASPGKFTFPAGTTLSAGEYLTVLASAADGTPGLHTGFALSQDGEGVYLLDRATNGEIVLDSVVFGLQIANQSIGRLGNDASWLLTQPSLGAANAAQPLGSQATLKINEWLALGQTPFADDFVELYNPAALPVALGGLYLTDEPFGTPGMHRIAPLSFIAALGHQAFRADGSPQIGANHLNFQLAAEQGLIALMDADLSALDQIWYGPQTLNLATGRCPDGSARISTLTFPTPGSANACPPEPIPPLTLTLLATTNVWRYDQSGANLGTAWRGTNYDDSAWPDGPGVLGYDAEPPPEPFNTPLTVGTSKTSFYFRTTFVLPAGTNASGLQLTHLVDDGAVFYLNGEEAYRYNMPGGTILATNFSLAAIDNASYGGPVSLPLTNLHTGTNLLAVEVHQNSRTSGDIVFGCQLDLIILTNPPGAAGLVINEVAAQNASFTYADGRTPDWIELFNPSDSGVDLSDMSLSDSADLPRRWVFPPGATIDAHGYFLIRFDADLPASGTNTGFGLKADGDSVYLFDKPANLGVVLDFISFGLQTPDFSLGRLPGESSTWNLTLPTPGATNLAVALGDPMQLKLNEWMADASASDDWFEIYNPQPLPVALGGLWLTDNLTDWNKSQIPPLSFIGVATNAYQRFWADNQSGGDHADFALKAAGEQLALCTPTGLLIDGLSFGAQATDIAEGRLPDGAATRAFFTSPTPGHRNYLPLQGIVISEVLAHTDLPLEDAIELQNLTASALDLSGWWLSDDNDQPQKYQLPTGTVLPAGGFAVFYEYQFNDRDHAAVPFALSSAKGDQVYLSAADTNGALTGFSASVRFGPSAQGVSFGRHLLSTGEADFTPMSLRSFGADNPADLLAFRSGAGLSNAYPLVGPVVISEIMYHPPDLGTNDNVIEEFIELHNRSSQTAFLYDTNHPTNTWRLREAVDFDFPPGVSLAPGSTLAVVSFDPATNTLALAQFQARYGTNAQLFGPSLGKLDNSGESVELYRPDAPETLPGPDFGLVPFLLVDRVSYRDLAPWPTNADGGGYSLQRVNPAVYGNEPTNWAARTPTPHDLGPSDSDGDGMTDEWELANNLDRFNAADALLDSDGDGQSNLNEFLSGTDPQNAQSLFQVEFLASAGGEAQIQFLAIAGHTYSVQFRSTLASGAWTNLVNIPARATNWTVIVPDPGLGTASQRFYRLVTPALP